MAGSKVQFKTRQGKIIPGMVTRIKRKNAEVLSLFDQHGLKHASALRWTCDLGILIPLTPEQAKLMEFP